VITSCWRSAQPPPRPAARARAHPPAVALVERAQQFQRLVPWIVRPQLAEDGRRSRDVPPRSYVGSLRRRGPSEAQQAGGLIRAVADGGGDVQGRCDAVDRSIVDACIPAMLATPSGPASST
jgi:hypothetical protein